MQETTETLSYDGPFMGMFQYTELDKSKASFGTSFVVKDRSIETVSRRREEKRVQFESARK